MAEGEFLQAQSKPSAPIMTSNNSVTLSCLPYSIGHKGEGVSLLLNMGEYPILLDCGLSELDFAKDSQFPTVELVFCSHAHSDHCRGLLAFHQAFPQVPIYTSKVTSKLLPLNWSFDQDVTESLPCKTVDWRSPVTVRENLQLELFPAGHLPGAAAILLTYHTPKRDYKVMYTGDFSVSNFQLVEGLSIENLRGIAPDVLIIEGSYGTVRHPHRRQQEKQLMERIEKALGEGKNVLLPVPTVGLGQEILKLLRSHHQFTGKDLDIWVDEKVSRACDVYLELLSQFPLSVQNFAKHQSLFWDERVCPRMSKLHSLEDLLQGKLPSIVLIDSDSEILSYLSPELGEWLILLPEHPQEYVTKTTAQQSLQNLASVTLETYLLAEHSDGRNTTQLIHNLRPQHIIFVHGSPSYLVELASLPELCNRYQVHSPANGTLVELPIGDRFIQPKTPTPTHYEGELSEASSYIKITFPDTLNRDPRWNKFADTGIVEARWQGEELILRGIPQRELLNSVSDSKMSVDLDCCRSCRYYHHQRCWNQASPLYGFKVIPEGYCPVFEPLVKDN